MKKLIAFTVVVALVLAGSIAGSARTVTVDGLFLVGRDSEVSIDVDETRVKSLVRRDELHYRSSNLVIGGQAEIYPNLVVEGRLLTGWATQWNWYNSEDKFEDLETGDSLQSTQWLVGASYRVENNCDLDLYLGGGYTKVKLDITVEDRESSVQGKGLYGKVGAGARLGERISINGDFAYAPKATYERDAISLASIGTAISNDDEEGEGSISQTRGSVVYHVNDMVGLQVGFTRTKIEVEFNEIVETVSGVLYGAGVILYF